MTQRPRRPGRKPSFLITVRYPQMTIGGGVYAAIGAPPVVMVAWRAGVLLIGAPDRLPTTPDWSHRTYTLKPDRQVPRSTVTPRPLARKTPDGVAAPDGVIYRSPRISAQKALQESGLADGSYCGEVEHGYLRLVYQSDAAETPAPVMTERTIGTAVSAREWWTLREIQDLCELSHSAIYRAIKSGDLEIDPELSARLRQKIVRHAALLAYLRHRQATVGEQYPELLRDENQ